MKPGWLAIAALGCATLACKDDKPSQASLPPAPAEVATAAAPKRDATTDKAPPAGRTAPRRQLAELPPEYRRALRAGRRARSFVRALEHFEKALAAVPDDPVALSEMSWAYAKLDEFDQAIAAADRSIARASRPSLKAASLYNKGFALEGKGQREAAIAAYRASVLLRPHPGVAKRLATLTNRPAPKNGVLQPVALEGPMNFSVLCDGIGDSAETDEPEHKTCKIDEELANTAAPFRRIVSLAPKSKDDGCWLGIETAAGWFRATGYVECFATDWSSQFSTSLGYFKLVSMKSGPPVLVLQTHVREGSKYMESSESYFIACGIGPSGQPSCTPAVQTGASEWENDHTEDSEEIERHEHREVRVDADGVLVVGKGPKWAVGPGSYTLAFP